MSHPESGSQDTLPERFTPIEPTPRQTGVETGKTRVTVRGFVTVGPAAVDGEIDYLVERIKSEAANGDLYIDGVYPDNPRCNEEMVYQLAQTQAEAGRLAIEGWEVVDAHVAKPSPDGIRVNISGFADLSTAAIIDDPPFDKAAAELSDKTLLSAREAELSVLRDRGLTHQEAAGVMGVTKGTTDKLSQRITEKEQTAQDQIRQAQATLDHLSESDDE